MTASCGLDFHNVCDLNDVIEDGCRNGYDFVCVNIFNPRYRREFIEGPATERRGPVTRSDLVLSGPDWSSLIVGRISPWIDLDNKNEDYRKNSERAFKQELVFAMHLSIPAIIIKLKSFDCVNLARNLNSHITNGPNQQFWVQVPLYAHKDSCDPVFDDDEAMDTGTNKETDTWLWWNRLRALCDHNKKLGVALEISSDIHVPPDEVIRRWAGEPVKLLVIPTSIFLTNKQGYPVLSRAVQSLVLQFFKLDVQILITGNNKHSGRGIQCYHQYMNYLFKGQPELDPIAQFARGYEDYLQCPLQPLMDNLESQTYEVFEKDPVKYAQYQLAVYKALLDRIPEAERETKHQVVMVVGAGRGPLVKASLLAAAKANRNIKVYAVEKNPNAVVTLENRKAEEWGDSVTVVSSDMRFWKAPEKADILVSELLGSFGDNELSPECLDGAQMFLKDDGISIPYSYTSFVAPIQSSKLYNEVKNCKDKDKNQEAPYETPYVVRIHNANLIDQPRELFTFTHPNRGKIDNSRYGHLEFKVGVDSVLHGLAGYFETVLYKDVMLSINPNTHSPGMYSWFPILFPIKEPMYLKKGDTVGVRFWRCITEKNVWFEWCVTDPNPTHIHNIKGRSYTIGLL